MGTRPHVDAVNIHGVFALSLLWLVCLAACANGHDRPTDGGGRADAGANVRCDDGERCGAVCVDTNADPDHCGGCGRTCVIPNATSACEAGACAVGTCRPGFVDCNADPNDGCERAIECAEGASCATACGTTGSTRCDDVCTPVCAPPAESCNLIDDDCDGACEAGLPGCRLAVHRSNGPNGHFYTTSRDEAACCSMSVESYDFFFLSALGIDGTSPLMRCLAPDGHHLYTTDTGCEGVAYEGQMGFVARSAVCGAVPLYRLFLGGNHFYTTSAPERDSAIASGYEDRGIVGYVWTTP
jgi:hypothetical protein